MSTSLSISFVPKNNEYYSQIYNRLCNWISVKCDTYKVYEILDSSNYTTIEISEVDPIDILASNRSISLDFFFSYEQLIFRGTLWLNGKENNGGYSSKQNGQVYFTFDERDLLGQYRSLLKNKDYEKLKSIEIDLLFSISNLFVEIIEELECFIKYASFYTESGMPTSFTSSMAYLAGYKNLVDDFEKVYVESRTEMSLLEFYNAPIHSQYDIMEIKNTLYYKSFEDERKGSLLSFIESLDIDKINRLKSLEEKDIKKIMETVLLDNRDILFTKLHKGFVLSTYPLIGLWSFYYDFLKEFDKSTY